MKRFKIVVNPLDENESKICYNGLVDTNSYVNIKLPVMGALYNDEIIKEVLELPLSELEKEVALLHFKSQNLDINLLGYSKLHLNIPNRYQNNYIEYLSYHKS